VPVGCDGWGYFDAGPGYAVCDTEILCDSGAWQEYLGPSGPPWTYYGSWNVFCGIDSDNDGLPDTGDFCPATPDPLQEDTYPPYGNGIGDACDCEGNFNCASDSDVDGSDATLFKGDFGRSAMQEPCTGESPCNGDFNCDGDADGTDASLFKSDFGRSSIQNPCPVCVAGAWCTYQ
jgi:hypothetical protein